MKLSFPSAQPSRRYEPAPASAEVYLTVRWSSALPIREALATGRSRVAPEPEHYLIEVFGIPATIASNRLEQFQKEFAGSARLTLAGRRTLQPESVVMPGIGMHLSAAFRFPRWENLTDREGSVEFSTEASGLKIRQPFKLADMHYRGRLEL